MSGLFDTFTIAKRGLNVQQAAINTTSHNIANANTEGYSRQRAVAETTKPFGGAGRFDTCSVGQVGTGAEITSIQRIRDSFIDYQVRSETGTSGYFTTKSDTLSQVQDVLGEPSDSGMQELISQFYNAFQEVSKNPDKADVKTVAVKKASALADSLNYAYNQLKKISEDTQSTLRANVTDVNSYLDQINELNKQIRGVSAIGQTPNDLMDKRDNLLDQLSSKFGIKIDRDDLDTINLWSTEYPDESLVKSDPNDKDYSRLSYVKDGGVKAVKDSSGNLTGEVTVEYCPLGNKNAATKSFTVKVGNAGDADLATKTQGIIDDLTQNRILIGDKDGTVTSTTTDAAGKTTKTTNPPKTVSELYSRVFKTYENESGVNSVDNNHIKGEIASNQSVQTNIKTYMDNLDRLAAGLAYSVNAIQTGSIDSNTVTQGLSNNIIFVNGTSTTTDTGITAATIKVNSTFLNNSGLLNCNTTSTSGEGDGKRAAAIANLKTIKMSLSNVDSDKDLTKMTRKDYLTAIGVDATGFSDTKCLNLKVGTEGSTIDSYYNTIVNNLAVANQEATRISDNQTTILAHLEDQKESISGVSLDDEMTNLIQYQHAYQANAKIVATIDELLDVVINGLKK